MNGDPIDRTDDFAMEDSRFVSAHDDTIRFRYTVQAGDRDADGIGIPAHALQLNGATIADVLGEAVALGLDRAQLILPADKVDGAAADATPPAVRAVTIVSQPTAAGYAYGDRVSVTDYVCGMTDSFAKRLHAELFNGR